MKERVRLVAVGVKLRVGSGTRLTERRAWTNTSPSPGLWRKIGNKRSLREDRMW